MFLSPNRPTLPSGPVPFANRTTPNTRRLNDYDTHLPTQHTLYTDCCPVLLLWYELLQMWLLLLLILLLLLLLLVLLLLRLLLLLLLLLRLRLLLW